MDKKEFVYNGLEGEPIKITFSSLAEQANSACLVQKGDTVILATAVMGKKDREGIDFFPLSVEYQERFYAAGQILGSRFVRRENRPTENAILTGRLIDRSIRPLFDHRLRREVQIVLTILSLDEENDPDWLSLLAASLVLGTSDIPWNGPISGLRAGLADNGKAKINLSINEPENKKLDAFASVVAGKINMVEIGADETDEKDALSALKLIVEEAEKLNEFQKEIIGEMGKEKQTIALKEINPHLIKETADFLKNNGLEEAIYAGNKKEMSAALSELEEKLAAWAKESEFSDDMADVFSVLEKEIDDAVHRNILEKNKRPDGRKLDEIRTLDCQVGLLPRRVHGSGLFVRGQTQALSSITLASPAKGLTVEGIEYSGQKNFIHHYNFPPFSTGETGNFRGPGRREIGHGALAEKAIRPIIPTKEEFPYAIRIVSEVLSSNGSSSMASTCGSTLALMDAGVPIKKPVAGIAMGLILENENSYKVLTDIQGPEDHYGDMDFKAAGTDSGLTACQLDVKIEGLTLKMVEDTLAQAKEARLKILEKIKGAISEPRKELSPFAPKITIISIKPDQIGLVVGSGGKTIKEIMEKTKAEIDIDDDGSVYITGIDEDGVKKAAEIITAMTKEYSVGDVVEGEVVKLMEFGAIVEFAPHKDGLVHISEISYSRVEKVEDALNLGDKVKAKIIRLEEGRTALSIKALLPKPEGYEENSRSDEMRRRPMSRGRNDRFKNNHHSVHNRPRE